MGIWYVWFFLPPFHNLSEKNADDDPDSDQVSINFGTYRILYQTECTKRRDKLRCGELGRSIVINKGKDIKTISNHLGWLADFKYIAVITTSKFT